MPGVNAPSDAPGRYGTAGNVKRTRPSKRSKSRSKLTKRQPLAMAMAAELNRDLRWVL
ncbi:hypothetical protein ACLM45_08235 [Synechococcus sp. A10-1-5-9]|uniref:hypothetical protein n=1 Tax=Synechococcus sp. A10-1-5-9 TaxID=3392295 RepID=UPI0039E9FFEA